MIAVPLLALSACGGQGGAGVVRIEGPTFEPRRVAIRTLEPGPTPTPTPTPAPATPTPLPTPTPAPVGPPQGVTLTSQGGTQRGGVGEFCWSEHVGGPSRCYSRTDPDPARVVVRSGEVVLIRIEHHVAPDDESIRPFQGSRSGYPSQRIEPALETELTVDLPPGEWSMDLCAAWHGRGQPICWLFGLDVTEPT